MGVIKPQSATLDGDMTRSDIAEALAQLHFDGRNNKTHSVQIDDEVRNFLSPRSAQKPKIVALPKAYL